MRRVLKLVVSVSLLVLAISMLDINVLIAELQNGSIVAFVLAIIVNIVTFAVMGVRWCMLASTQIKLPFVSQLAVYFRATFLNTFTPANLGGDAYRLVALKNISGSAGDLLKLLLRERVLGLYGYVITFLVAYFLVLVSTDHNFEMSGNPYVYGLIFAAAALLIPILARPLGQRTVAVLRGLIGQKRLPSLETWVDTLADLLSPKGTFVLALLTIIGIMLWVISIKIVAIGYGVSVSLLDLAVVATLVELIRLVPITVQGIGLREGVFAFLLAYFGNNAEQCYAVGLVAYLALSVSIVLCGPLGHLLSLSGMRREAQ